MLWQDPETTRVEHTRRNGSFRRRLERELRVLAQKRIHVRVVLLFFERARAVHEETARPHGRRCRVQDRALQRAETLTLDCDLFLAIGSSLVVWPAAGFPLLAKRNGARLVIINREATEFDEIADLVVREDIGTVLSPFIVH